MPKLLSLPKNIADPLKSDPSRTSGIRVQMTAEITRRFEWLAKRVRWFIVEEDSLGLKKPEKPPTFASAVESSTFGQLTGLSAPTVNRYKFATNDEKVEGFKTWFKQQVESGVLESDKPDAPWTSKYVESAYKKAAIRSYTEVKKEVLAQKASFFEGSKAEFLNQAFNTPEAVSKIKLISTRAYDQLKGVTASMDQKISVVLGNAVAGGWGADKTAAALNKEVVELGAKRARVIARTELIHAHAEGQLDSFENLGVEEVGLLAEWKTAGDLRVCPLCQAQAGKKYTLAKARGLIPFHPNCRCAWIAFFDFAPGAEKPQGPAKPKGKKPAQKTPEQIKAEEEKAAQAKKAETLKKAQAAAKAAKAKAQKELIAQPLPDDLEGLDAYIKKLKAAKIVDIDDAVSAGEKIALAQEKKGELVKAKKAADLAAKKAAETAKKAIEAEKAGALPDLVDLKKIKSLPGSTRPDLMENTVTGKKWVMKSTQSGLAPAHLESEALADKLYRIADVDAPVSGIIKTAEGPAKLAEYLEGGQTLADWSAGKTAAQVEAMYKQIGNDFVMDALLANHDVVGLSFDNIFVVGPQAYRIDNGGALLYRAQGGAKQNFGKVVQELDSMRDASVNAQTAKVFGHLTEDDINRQIEGLLPLKEKILGAVPDAKLRNILEQRLEYLAARVKPPAPVKAPKAKAAKAVAGGAKARAEQRLAEPTLLPDTAERVKEARVNGVTIKGDREDIEDLNMLAWEEKNVDGETVTRFQLKVTKAGSDKIKANLDPEVLKLVQKSAGPVAQMDSYEQFAWDKIQKAAKTVAVHAADKGYNQTTIQEFNLIKTVLDQDLKNPYKDKKMVQHYLGEAKKIDEAIAKGVAPGKVVPYVPKAKKVKHTTKAGTIPARVVPLEFNEASIENGRVVRRIHSTNKIGYGTPITQFELDLGDGVLAHFHENSGSLDETMGLAFQGNVELTIPKDVSTDSLKLGMDKLRTMGINVDPPTPEYEELLYLHRSVYLRNDHEKDAYKNIFNSNLPDGEKVAKIKAWASKEYGVSFENNPSYRPEGFTKDGAGNGYRHWDRWDLPRAQVEKDLQGYSLHHHSSQSTASVVDKILQTGGEFTSTVQRVRKGVSLGTTGGMSSQADINTGGASYFFTRITNNTGTKYEAQGPNRGSFRFKIGALARQDAVTYSDDHYGRVSAFSSRKSTVEQYKSVAGNGSNETIFKHGLSLLDDLEEIAALSETERGKILEAFRKNKVTHLNDGRAVEDVVVVR